jgi:hypothetical protein
VKVEEDGGDESDEDAGFIPKRRLRDVGVTVDRQAKRTRLVSSRRDRDGGVSYVSRNVGCAENGDVEVEDEAGLALSVKEWRGYVESS